MPLFRRFYVPGAVYFIVAVTAERRPIFASDVNVTLFLSLARRLAGEKPYRLLAYAIIPDHVNVLMEPTGDRNISSIMLSLKRTFTLGYKQLHGVRDSTVLWQPRFWDHIIRNEADLRRHLDYIHYQPVKHGLASRPWDYPHTSFRQWVASGFYEPGWGSAEPEDIKGLSME
jgi:putative transposase